MIKVDAMGQACPLPVVMANKALKERKNGESVEVHVDNEIAVQNLQRMAAKQNLDCSVVAEDTAHFILTLSGAGAAVSAEAPVVCIPQATDNVVVAVSSKTMGSGSEELGALLMKGFLYALTQQEQLPKTVLYNLIEGISIGASLLESFMPSTAKRIAEQLNGSLRSLDECKTFGIYPSGNKVTDKP